MTFKLFAPTTFEIALAGELERVIRYEIECRGICITAEQLGLARPGVGALLFRNGWTLELAIRVLVLLDLPAKEVILGALIRLESLPSDL